MAVVVAGVTGVDAERTDEAAAAAAAIDDDHPAL